MVSHAIRQQFFIADKVGINAASCTNNEHCTVHYLVHYILFSLSARLQFFNSIRKLMLGRNRGSFVHTFAKLQALYLCSALGEKTFSTTHVAKIGGTSYI